jgi:hypothetical protein
MQVQTCFVTVEHCCVGCHTIICRIVCGSFEPICVCLLASIRSDVSQPQKKNISRKRDGGGTAAEMTKYLLWHTRKGGHFIDNCLREMAIYRRDLRPLPKMCWHLWNCKKLHQRSTSTTIILFLSPFFWDKILDTFFFIFVHSRK